MRMLHGGRTVTEGEGVLTGGQSAYQTLRARILSGELPANAMLREQALAEELGVSRTPIREALRRLDEAGLVEFIPNRGATVLAWSVDQMRETYFMRASLEGRAAGLAAVSIGTIALGRLAALIDEMEAFVDSSDDDGIASLARLNAEFHRIIVTAAGSKQLLAWTESVGRIPLMERNFRRHGAEFRARSNHQHRDILTALRTRDALWADVAMRSHILAARNVVSVLSDEETAG